MTRYRIRVRTPDGQEKLTEFEFDAPAATYQLETPTFSDAEFAHGDSASVTVQGTGLEGKMIQFVIEHEGASGWEPYAQASAQMTNGVATAAVDLHHPYVTAGGAAPETASPASLRMSCRVMQ